jgi:hypothetical protein
MAARIAELESLRVAALNWEWPKCRFAEAKHLATPLAGQVHRKPSWSSRLASKTLACPSWDKPSDRFHATARML